MHEIISDSFQVSRLYTHYHKQHDTKIHKLALLYTIIIHILKYGSEVNMQLMDK